MAIVAVGLASWGGRRAVESLLVQVQHEVTGRVAGHVRGLLQEAHAANDVQRALATHGGLSLHDEERWRAAQRDLADRARHISYLTVADDDGGWFGLQLLGSRHWARTRAGGYDVFALSDDGVVGAQTQRIDPYDSWAKDWYRIPARTGEARWSPIYVWAHPQVLSMTLSEPLQSDDGSFGGIVGVDLALGDLHDALEPIDVGPGGRVFVVEPDGHLVATSEDEPPYASELGRAPVRLRAQDYGDPIIAGLAAGLRPHRGVPIDARYVPARIEVGDAHYRVRAESLRDDGLHWVVVVALDESDLLSDVWAAGWGTAWAGLAFAGLALVVGVWVARRVSAPLARLSAEVQQVRDFKLDNAFEVDSGLTEIGQLQVSLRTMQMGLVSFQRFVPADLVRRILAMGEEARLGGESRDVSVLFSDLVGYSALSEVRRPEEVIHFMNRYFDAMQAAIDAHDGVVLELMGDAILVVFGAPDPVEDHPDKAARCALAMRVALEELNKELEVQLGHRIGVHTGNVVAGNIGGHKYMKYGIIGDVVNVAARLEQLNKPLGTSVLVSDEVLQLAPSVAARARDLGEVTLKGRDQAQRVHALE